MKIIARTSSFDSGPLNATYLVEMRGWDIERITGMRQDQIKIGAEAAPEKVFDLLNCLQRQQKDASRAAANFRSLADLLDTTAAECAKHVHEAPPAPVAP